MSCLGCRTKQQSLSGVVEFGSQFVIVFQI
jgi:hypothetical protein